MPTTFSQPPTTARALATSTRWIYTVSVPLVLMALLPLLMGSDYQGNALRHFTMEVGGAFAALVVALLAAQLALERREGLTPYVAIGFLCAGLTDLLHASVAMGVVAAPVADLDRFIPGTWTAGRTTLGILLLLGLVRCSRNPAHRPSSRLLILIGPVLTVGVMTLFSVVELPAFIMTEWWNIHRPWEMLPALLFALTLWQLRSCASLGLGASILVPSLLIGIATQLLMTSSIALFGDSFDASHLLKVASYIVAAGAYAGAVWQRSRYSLQLASGRPLTAVLICLLAVSSGLLVTMATVSHTEAEEMAERQRLASLTRLHTHLAELGNPFHDLLSSIDTRAPEEFAAIRSNLESAMADVDPDVSELLRPRVARIYVHIETASEVRGDTERHRLNRLFDDELAEALELLRHLEEAQGARVTKQSDEGEAQHAALSLAVLLLTVVAVPVLSVVGATFSRRQLRPILDLTDVAIEFGAGDRGLRAEVVGEDEISHLTQTFNSMMDAASQTGASLEDRLRERTAGLTAALDYAENVIATVRDPLVVLTDDLRVHSANPSFHQMTRTTSAETEGRPIYELVDGRWDVPQLHVLLEETLPEHGEIVDYELELEFPDIGVRTMLLNARPIVSAAEATLYLLAMSDITDRKAREEETVRVGQELAQLIDTANAPIFGIDVHGRIDEWNQSAAQITGYSRDEALGEDFVAEFIAAEFREPVGSVMSRALAGEGTSNYVLPLDTKSGERVQVLLNATPRRDLTGEITGVVGVGQDITELISYRNDLERRVEERTTEVATALDDAEEARNSIDAILESVTDGLVVANVYGRVTTMNHAAEEQFGVRLSEMLNRRVEHLLPFEERKAFHRAVRTALKTKTSVEPFEINRDDRVLRVSTSVVLDRAGKDHGCVFLVHDMTREHEVDRMKSEFISTAAHELRTPLTSIQGFSEILLTRDELAPEETRRFLTHINRQSQSLTNIIGDLLDLSRIESGTGFALERRVVDIRSLLEQSVAGFEQPDGQHTFDLFIPDGSLEVVVDGPKMEQVLKNLISNAVKYSPEGGRIEVAAAADGNDLLLSVKDQGIGMTAEQVEHVFDKFYRVDASNTAIEGTGLGMNIVHAITEAHGGTVHIESQLGEGTTVSLRLPREV